MPDAGDAAAKAALGEARDVRWPPSDDDAARIAQAAGRAAGASACAAAGLAPAAPLCGLVAGRVAKLVTQKIARVFTRRADRAWRKFHTAQARARTHAAGQAAAFALATAQGEAIAELTDSLRDLYRELAGVDYPGDANDVRRALAFLGAPFIPAPGRTAADGRPLLKLSFDPFRAWDAFYAQAEPLIRTNAKGAPLLSDGTTARLMENFWREAEADQDAQVQSAGRAAAVLAAKIAADHSPQEGQSNGSAGGALLLAFAALLALKGR